MALFSCHSQKQDADGDVDMDSSSASSFVEIDIGANLKDSGEKMLLSDLVEDVEYIKLEATEASIMNPIALTIFNGDNFFFKTMGNNASETMIKVFDRAGKFVRNVGRFGHGPGEYLLARGVSVNDSLLYINTNWLHKIMVYNWRTNQFVKEIPLNGRIVQNISCLEGSHLALFPGASSVPKTNVALDFFNAVLISDEGEEKIVSLKNISGIDTTCFEEYQNVTTYLYPYFYENHSHYYDDINDTIYRVSSDTILSCYFINKGKYKMPLCSYFQDNNFNERNLYIGEISFIETGSCLYMNFSCQRKNWIVCYRKSDKTLKYWIQESRIIQLGNNNEIAIGKGFYNDIDGGLSPTWNTLDGGKYIYTYISQDNLDAWSVDKLKSKTVKFPEKQQQLIKMLEEYGEDDNPIIVLYKLKQ